MQHYDVFTMQTLYKIAKDIYTIISTAQPEYTDIIFFSNNPKSFFMQVPEKTILLPTMQTTLEEEKSLEIKNYIWEQSALKLSESLTKEYINFSIQSLLFNSLFAEQAARFNSMDSATRNAEELLETLNRQYNKLRQAKITKEIAEVSGSK